MLLTGGRKIDLSRVGGVVVAARGRFLWHLSKRLALVVCFFASIVLRLTE